MSKNDCEDAIDAGMAMLSAALRESDRRPRAAILIVDWGDDEAEVGLRLPEDPHDALDALKQMRERARDVAECFLKPRRCDA